MTDKIKIIHLLTHLPDYNYCENVEKPSIYWDTSDGSWVGIWGDEWAEIIGKEVVKRFNFVHYEVWQMDLRAKLTYEAFIHERLLHKKFPGKFKKFIYGIKFNSYVYSNEIINYILHSEFSDDYVFLVPATVETPFTKKLIKILNEKKIHFLHYNFLNSSLLYPKIVLSCNPLRIIHRFLIYLNKRNHLMKIKYLLDSLDNNPEIIEKIRKRYPHITYFEFNLGIDLNYWKPDIDKLFVRNELKISKEKFVFFMSQRLIPEYQIDKVIMVASKLSKEDNFLFIISGRGEKQYEEYLRDLVCKYKLDEFVKFVGYVPNDLLKKYYIACDVFLTVPFLFGGSNSAVKALALEKPIIHVNIGTTYEFLKKHNAGLIIEPFGYNEWVSLFHEVINGREIKIVPRKVIENHFSWCSTASQLLYAINITRKTTKFH